MIDMLIMAIAITGIVAVAILFLLTLETHKSKQITKHRTKDAGFADLLIYAALIDDGIIIGKDGSLMAAWLYQADDNASTPDEQREAIAARINHALLTLGNGWMVHVDAVRRSTTAYSDAGFSHFPDAITQAIDDERRVLFSRLGEMFESYFVITFTFLPPSITQSRFTDLMYDDDTESTKNITEITLSQFKKDLFGIESRLSSAFKLTRLKAERCDEEDGSESSYDHFLSWLQFCITGKTHPMKLPTNPMYLDCHLGGEEFWAGITPKIGKHYLQIVAIEGLPFESTPGMLTALSELSITYRWSSRFIFLDAHEAQHEFEKFRKKWKQKVRGIFDQIFNPNSTNIDVFAQSMVDDASAAIADVNSGLVAHGYYTSVIVLMDADLEKLEAETRSIEKAVNRLGFTARIETVNTMDAFFGSLPGHGAENIRRPVINSMNLADLLPTSTIWTGNVNAPCPFYPPHSPALMHCVTQGSTPFRLNLHVGDIGHTFMFGPTGAGKSTHLAILAAQFRRYQAIDIFVFDKGMSMYPLCAAIHAMTQGADGRHFTIAGDDEQLAFCPLQYLETKADRAWAMEWIATILSLNGIDPTPHQRNAIASAIINMHQNGNVTLSDFVLTVQDTQIREALQQYTVDGSMGHLLDAREDGLSFSKFSVFEIEELMNLSDKYALPVLLYLFRRIERALKGQPAVIMLDEAWLMLGHPVFRDKIREWLKVLRKANCLVLMATQSLSDAANSGILDVIAESTKTKLFLPNVYARDEETSKLYKRLGLNKRQIDILASATPKQHYYYFSELGVRLYSLALGPLALALVGASDKESIATIKKLHEKYGHDWLSHWLAMRNVAIEQE